MAFLQTFQGGLGRGGADAGEAVSAPRLRPERDRTQARGIPHDAGWRGMTAENGYPAFAPQGGPGWQRTADGRE